MTPRTRLFFRIAALSTALVFLGGVVPALITLKRHEEQMMGHLVTLGTSNATTMSLAAAHMLAAEDLDSLSTLAATMAHEQGFTTRAAFYDDRGTIVAHSDPDEEERVDVVRKGVPEEVETTQGEGAILVRAPVLVSGAPWGTLELRLSTRPIQRQITAARLELLETNGVLLLLSILGAAWLAHSIVRPVERLSQVAQEVAQGNLEIRTGMSLKNELGSLPSAIDQMIEDLAAARCRDEEQARKLSEARDQAIQASRAKSDFLANMSHELRTPLTGILGYAAVLAGEKQSEETLEGLQIIHDCGEHLLNLINSILDLSKIEANRMTVEVMSISPAAVVEEVAALYLGDSLKSGVELRTAVAPNVPEFIETDPTKLRQIILNLVNNSLKFTEEGSVTISVGFDPANDTLQVEIRDTGIGMTEEAAQGLFQPFTQADSSTTRRFGGTGLGLAISRRLARLLGGDVCIKETAPWQGTCLLVTVSAHAASPQELAGASSRTR